MTMLSFQVPAEIEQKVALIAAQSGTSVELLLNDMTKRMVEDFDAYCIYQEMAAEGSKEVDVALDLLRKPNVAS